MEQDGPKKFIDYFAKNYGSDVGRIKIFYSPYARNYQIIKLNNMTMVEVAREQFTSVGVLPENIIDPGIDVAASSDYPSYSNGDKKMRFAIIVRKIGD